MKKILKAGTPNLLLKRLGRIRSGVLKTAYRAFGRPFTPAETSKARTRRMRDSFFETFCGGKGLDVGFGGDPVTADCRGWDFEHGDAQYLDGIEDAGYDFVYSSHTLEHMDDPTVALQNWWRAVKPGGYLILYVPHRDLYEKKRTLPSRWSPHHQRFFLIDQDDPPDTVGIVPLLKRSISGFEIVYVKECSEGHTITDPETHSDGEYSIEAVIRKQEN
jgi:SAM-dependent methyltransferase